MTQDVHVTVLLAIYMICYETSIVVSESAVWYEESDEWIIFQDSLAPGFS